MIHVLDTDSNVTHLTVAESVMGCPGILISVVTSWVVPGLYEAVALILLSLSAAHWVDMVILCSPSIILVTSDSKERVRPG